MNYTVESIFIERAQRSLTIKAILLVPTRTQFTDFQIEIDTVIEGAHLTRSLPIALFKFWRICRKKVRQLQAEPGKYDMIRSNSTQGILRIRP